MHLIINSGYEYPAKKITINLAPADLPKEGGRYDLPIAIALLAASEQLTANKLDEYELVGELALTGALRGVPGAISSATEAIKSGRKIIVAKDNEDEVGLINGEGGNDSNLLIVFYVQIMPDDFVMQLHRF